MLELQTDVFGWLLGRKQKNRYGIGIHSDGNCDAVLAAIGAAGCGYFPFDYTDLTDGTNSDGRYVWGLMSAWPPRDRFNRFEPKTIRWDSVPEHQTHTLPLDHPLAHFYLCYGLNPNKPRKIHQGTARYYN